MSTGSSAGERPAVPRSSGPYRRALQQVGGGMALIYLVWVLPHWDASHAMGPLGPALVALAVAAQLVMAYRGFTGRMDGRDVVLAGAAMTALLLVDVGIHPTGVGIQASPAYPLVALTLVLATGFIPLRRFWMLAVPTVSVLYVSGRTWSSGLDATWSAVDELMGDLGPLAVVAYTIAQYVRAARRADDAVRIAAVADPQHRAAEDRDRLANDRRRVLHDEVIGSLVAIQHAQDDGPAREAAGRALAALEEPLGVGEPVMVDLALTRTPLHLDVEASLFDDQLPRHVGRAMTAAAAEAVRNADRHARAGRIVVAARPLPTGVVVTISDDGVGFDPESHVGFGVPHSIVERMHEVGGQAHLRSAPDEGTTVTLSWQVEDDQVYSPPQSGGRRRFAAVATGLALVGSMWLIAAHADTAIEGAVATTGVGLAMLTAVLTGARRLGATVLVALTGALAGTTWWGLQAAGTGATIDFDAWVVTLVCVPLFTLACFVRYLHLLLIGAALSSTVLVWTVLDATSVATAQDAITQPLFFALTFGALAAGLRRARLAAVRAELDLVDSLRRDARRVSRSREIAERETALRRSLVPFLSEVRDHGLVVGTHEVSRLAHALAVQVRDEIHLPGQLDDELRDLLATARASGSTISIRPPAGTAPIPPLAPLLREVIDPRIRQRITMSLPDGTNHAARIVVVPGLDEVSRSVSAWAEIEQSPEATVLTVSTAPQTSR